MNTQMYAQMRKHLVAHIRSHLIWAHMFSLDMRRHMRPHLTRRHKGSHIVRTYMRLHLISTHTRKHLKKRREAVDLALVIAP